MTDISSCPLECVLPAGDIKQAAAAADLSINLLCASADRQCATTAACSLFHAGRYTMQAEMQDLTLLLFVKEWPSALSSLPVPQSCSISKERFAMLVAANSRRSGLFCLGSHQLVDRQKQLPFEVCSACMRHKASCSDGASTCSLAVCVS